MTNATDATVYLEPLPIRRVRRPTSIVLNEHSYGPAELFEESWLPIAFRAFTRLATRMPVRDILIIGTGSGLDALGAIEAFDPRSVTVTDLTPESLDAARLNIERNLLQPVALVVEAYAGDLLSCLPSPRRYSLIYENLPNLPAPHQLDIAAGTTAASFFAADGWAAPEPFKSHQLSLHYKCLQQCRSRVRPGGGVLTSIGGRVRLAVAFALHEACGLSPELVVFDAKIQSEPELIIPAYASAERAGDSDFVFYDPAVLGVVSAARADGLEGPALADAVSGALAHWRMTAVEALMRYERGLRVAHTVFMILGRPMEVTSGK